MVREPGLSLSPGNCRGDFEAALRRLDESEFQRRLFGRDASLWEGDQDAIANRLGWLSLPESMAGHLQEIAVFAEEVQEAGIQRVVLLGMGGSSLAPEVMFSALGPAPGHPPLTVLDTTDPATIAALDRELDPLRTLFIVSSKSGTTVETLSLWRYFAEKQFPTEETGARDNFAAISDPGTPLEKQANTEGFRRYFDGLPDVGGRFSALSHFGLVPAGATGLDIGRLLDSAGSLDVRSAIELGAALGGLAMAGRDKVTFFSSPLLRGFGAWAEQLLAESTGKRGKGIIPVDLEPLGPPEVYGDDRLFVYVRLAGEDGPDEEVRALEAAGQPVIWITLRDKYELGAEFLRWEIATAAAGALLGINPFDEPNVAEAKERTSEILRESFRGERLPEPQPDAGLEGIAVHASEPVRRFIHEAGGKLSLSALVNGGLARPGDYFALLAYIPRTPEHNELLTRARVALRDATSLATSVGYGPRYLHSTGQLFKGGPDKGVFIQIIAEDVVDLEIPGSEYTFGTLKAAQALGDLQALESRGRRVLRLNLGGNATDSLRRVVESLESGVPAGTRSRG